MCDLDTFTKIRSPNAYSHICKQVDESPIGLIDQINNLPFEYKIGEHDKNHLTPFIFRFFENYKDVLKKILIHYDFDNDIFVVFQVYIYLTNYAIKNNIHDSKQYVYENLTIQEYVKFNFGIKKMFISNINFMLP